jgi:hypothetical protein
MKLEGRMMFLKRSFQQRCGNCLGVEVEESLKDVGKCLGV